MCTVKLIFFAHISSLSNHQQSEIELSITSMNSFKTHLIYLFSFPSENSNHSVTISSDKYVDSELGTQDNENQWKTGSFCNKKTRDEDLPQKIPE